MRRVNHVRSAPVLRAIAMVAAMAIGCGDASAQTGGLLDMLFGGFQRASPPATPVPPPPASSSTPGISITVTPMPRGGSGGAVAHCVRLCDGGHFPLPRLASSSASPIKLCNALCPGTPTRIYWGSQIDRAMASNGAAYSSLDTAYKYRRARPSGCTCNGTDVFGTAAISIHADVTLQPGDIVVMDQGMRVFVGTKAEKHQSAEFTPMQDYRGLPMSTRRDLAEVRITPRPQTAPESLTFNARIIFGFEPLGSQFAAPESTSSVHR